MASTPVKLTVDVSEQQVAVQTDQNDSGISVIVTSGSSLGGGTLSVLVLPVGSDEAVFSPEVVDNTLIAGSQETYQIGANMRVYLTLSGATNPDVDVFISTYRGG